MRQSTKVSLILSMLLSAQHAVAYEIGNWDIHGTWSQGWILSENNNFIEDSTDGTFEFGEFGVNASTSIGEHITLGGQLFMRKYGAIGDDNLYLDWLSATYNLNDAVGFRAGKLKMPYGLLGETRDVDSLRTQILLPQGVYIEAFRGSINSMWGGSMFGLLDSANFGSLEYSVQLGRSAVNVDSGELNRLASYISVEVDDADDGDAGAIKLLWNTPVEGLRLGTTYSWSEFSVTGPTDSLLGFPGTFEANLCDQYFFITSAEYTWDDFTFSAEQLNSNIAIDFMIAASAIPAIEVEATLSGHYLNADYRATDKFTLAVGYSSFSLKQKRQVVGGAPAGSDEEKQDSYYASLRYDITPNLIAKVEQQFSTGVAGLFLTENPSGLKENWSMTLVKISFVF